MNAERRLLGQIGLGLLGAAIAERLSRHGFSPFGYDLNSDRCEEFAANRGVVAEAAGQVFRRCEVVILSLPHSENAAALIDDCHRDLQPGQIILDTTTGSPEEMVAIGHRLNRDGVFYVEANVAGSSRQMREGEASLFLGGDEEVLAKIQPVLDALADRHFSLGDVGSASRFKLVHNLVLGLHRAVLAEGLAFAESLGFAAEDVLKILPQTPASSAVMETKGRKMVNRDWQTEAKLSQHLKDVRLILALAEQTQTPIPLSRAHRDLLERAEQLGFGKADNSAILEAYRGESG